MEPVDIVKDDFAQTLAFIDKCDSHIFTIKNWALITTSAVIAFSVTQHKDFVSLFNLILLIPFIYLELIYKSFQDIAIEHNADISERIDKHLAGTAEAFVTGYSHSFGRKLLYPSVPRVFGLLRNRKRWHILNFYVLLAVISLGAFAVGQLVT
jgi:hypothetical protein